MTQLLLFNTVFNHAGPDNLCTIPGHRPDFRRHITDAVGEYAAGPDATKPTYLMAIHETNTGWPPIQECGNAIETVIEAGCPA